MTATDPTRPADSTRIKEHVITVLLVDDQAMVGEAVRRMLAGEQDIVFHFCQDPAKAMSMAKEIEPTVILQDLVMPEIDGLTLVKFFRAADKTRDIPLIVLSTKEEPAIKAEAFALGANDYLVKLPDRIELIARIRYHSKGYINLLQRNEVMANLKQELNEAAQYVEKMLPEPMDEKGVATDWRFITSTSLGGDAFGYHWADNEHLVLYLLDVCGHGVGAALLSVQAMNVLRSQTLVGVDFRNPAQVLGALNDTFEMEKHNNMYFTIWYGVYNRTDSTLRFASGGHPPALLLTGPSDAPAELQELITRNLIIGGMPGLEFQQDECVVSRPSRLYLFSDGVYEITQSDGSLWRFEDFAEFMRQPSASGESAMDRLHGHVCALNGSNSLDDDFSILEIRFHD